VNTLLSKLHRGVAETYILPKNDTKTQVESTQNEKTIQSKSNLYNQCSWIKNKTFFLGQVQKTQTGWIGQALSVIPVNPNVVTSASVAGHVDAANVAGHPPDVAVAVVRSRPAVRHVNDVFDTWNVVVAADVDVAQIRHDLVALPAAALAGRHLPVQPEQPQQDPPAFRN
jgi:hypothetical protein